MSQYGKFHNGCRDSTLPVCNFFYESVTRGGPGFGACQLQGFSVGGGDFLRNLGSIILAFFAILISLFLLWRSERKRAAVGRREMQLFLIGYILIEICEIFSVGGIPLREDVVLWFSAIHIGLITATTWTLMLNGIVGYQIIDDGKPTSLILLLGSATALFIGTAYICLDTAFSWTNYWNNALTAPNQNYAIYSLYLVVPLLFLFIYFCLESYLVIKVLGEIMPMVYLSIAVLLFAIGQIFNFVVSTHICNGTSGKIDGALFQTLFTLLAVITVWVFWSTITEDDWPDQVDSVTGSAEK